MRPIRTIAVVAVAIFALLAVPASAAPATALKVSPTTVVAGGTVTVSGSLGPAYAGSRVTLLSKAFTHAYDFAGVPAIFATVKTDGTFAVTTRIPASRAAGSYTVTGREGGGNLGVSATLVVQEAPATLKVSPSTVVAGGTVTVSGSVGLAPEGSGVTLISKAFAHTNDFAGLPAIFATVRPDGTFAVTTRIPATRAPATYTITGREGGGNLGVTATLVVRVAAAPTTTPAAAPPPATTPPQASAPPVTAPATQPAGQPASRWLIPGLAALVGGTLAAVGMSLWYRRRHPSGTSRQGRSRVAH